MSSQSAAVPVISAPADARARFIRQTYLHLAAAIVLFAILERALLQWHGAHDLADRMTGGYDWLLTLAVFMFVAGIANRWARNPGAQSVRYLGFGLFIVAEAILFLPLMLYARSISDANLIPSAGLLTLALVIGLTAVIVVTGADFSFLRGALTIGGFTALGLIVASIVFGFSLGIVFSTAMVAFAGGSVLYSTSGVLHSYRTDQPVAASLSLFSSIALLLWYVLQILGMRRQ
jgi:FtsH-binding integral membrane protein